MDFDRSWWTIRDKIDAYLEAADGQAAAFGEAVDVLDGYTSKCSATFSDLSKVQTRAIQADRAANSQLHDTWHAVEHELGLVSAKISDSHAFLELGRLDAVSADLEANRSKICGVGEAANQAAVLAVERSLQGGLAHQTWLQLQGVFIEIPMLSDRFLSAGLQSPSNKTWLQAWERTNAAFQELVDQRSDIAVEMASHLCSTKASLLDISQRITKDGSNSEKELKETKAGRNELIQEAKAAEESRAHAEKALQEQKGVLEQVQAEVQALHQEQKRKETEMENVLAQNSMALQELNAQLRHQTKAEDNLHEARNFSARPHLAFLDLIIAAAAYLFFAQ